MSSSAIRRLFEDRHGKELHQPRENLTVPAHMHRYRGAALAAAGLQEHARGLRLIAYERRRGYCPAQTMLFAKARLTALIGARGTTFAVSACRRGIECQIARRFWLRRTAQSLSRKLGCPRPQRNHVVIQLSHLRFRRLYRVTLGQHHGHGRGCNYNDILKCHPAIRCLRKQIK